MQVSVKRNAVFFIPATVALLDAVVDFAVPTHPKVNSDGVPYFGYLMLAVALYYLIKAIVASSNIESGIKYRPRIKFVSAVLILLGVIAYMTDKAMILPKIYFPSVNNVISSAIKEWEMLLTCTLYSIRLLFFGIVFGGIVGVGTGILIGWNKKINYWVYPIIRFIGPLPNAIWIPISLLVFPSLFSASVFIVALTMWFPTTIQTSSGIQNVSKGYYDVADTLGASTLYQILRISIPAAMPQIFVGIFSGVTTSFVSLMLAELMGSKYGIGWYINWKQQIMSYANVWVALLILATLCFFTIKMLFVLRNKFLSWQEGIIRW